MNSPHAPAPREECREHCLETQRILSLARNRLGQLSMLGWADDTARELRTALNDLTGVASWLTRLQSMLKPLAQQFACCCCDAEAKAESLPDDWAEVVTSRRIGGPRRGAEDSRYVEHFCPTCRNREGEP